MHILVTADTVGGVWTYTEELVKGLLVRGHRITLVSFGGLPSAEQTAWMSGSQLDYRPTEFRLEWMQEAEQDIPRSMHYLDSIIGEVNPDLLHLNQFAYGALPCGVPRIVVAHSDVISWWSSVHGSVPSDNHWLNWYRRIVGEGLRSATAVIAPSHTMLEDFQRNFITPSDCEVVYNGRDPNKFWHSLPKVNRVVSAGRLWDQAKQTKLLTEREQVVPVVIVGAREFDRERICQEESRTPPRHNVQVTGPLAEHEFRHLLAESSIYAGTSCYEPFGLAPLEAALSGCALVLNDIPSFREIWGDEALFFQRNDAASLEQCIALLARDIDLRQDYAGRAHRRAIKRYTSASMLDQYEAVYSRLACLGATA